MVEDAHGNPLSTSEDVAVRWRDLRHRQDRFEPAPDVLDEVREADPEFAVAAATRAVLGHLGGAPEDAVAADLAAARHGRADHAWERSHVDAVVRTVAEGRWGALAAWQAHHDAHPGDLLAMHVLMPTLVMSARRDRHDESEARLRASLAHVGEDPTLVGHLGMSRADALDLDEAERLGTRALELEPDLVHGAHPLAHVHFERGDHDAGRRWLADWLDTADPAGDYRVHLQWHVALHHLNAGDRDATLASYRGITADEGAGRVFDATTLLWRCQLHGLVPPEHDPAAPVVADAVAPMADVVPAVAVAYHVAAGLAAVGDVDGLERLGAAATTSDAPGAAELVPHLARGLAAFVRDDHVTAATELGHVVDDLDRIGGSLAQAEVVTDTWIEALIRADRDAEADAALRARLDRRPSWLDAAWLARGERFT